MKKLYHVSTTPNLKVLIPRASTHKIPYVYASQYPEFCLLIGSKKSHGDFDGSYGLLNKTVYFQEAYPNAFKERFQGETCYLYEVDPTTFQEGKTSFKGEVVSEEEVKVLSCEKIDDVYTRLLQEIKEGKLKLIEYSTDPDYQQTIRDRIKKKLIITDVINHPEWPIYQFCKQKFGDIMDEIINTNMNNSHN